MFRWACKEVSFLNKSGKMNCNYMRKRIWRVFLFVIAFGFVFSRSAHAQTDTLSYEHIVSYTADITVHVDNSVNVLESIVYNTGTESHHGIFRDIYLYSSQGRKMEIDDVRVTDEVGKPYIFTTFREGDYFRIKIGDPDRVFSGQKTYNIYYRATKAVGQFENFDEIYWDVTGNGWNMPILYSSAVVTFPSNAISTQAACYFGVIGSTNTCTYEKKGEKFYFVAPRELHSGEGLTIAAGINKGVIHPYTPSDERSLFITMYLGYIVSILLPIVVLVLSFLYWKKYGRDPRGTGVIVPQYDVPDNLTPMEVAALAQQKITSKDISAEIIYLATRGYLKIVQVESKLLWLIKQFDYKLVKLKDADDSLNKFDRTLLDALFNMQTSPFPLAPQFLKNIFKSKSHNTSVDVGTVGEKSVLLSELRDVFYMHAQTVSKEAMNSLVQKGYYRNLGRMKGGLSFNGSVVGIAFAIVIGSLVFGVLIGSIFFPAHTDVFILSLILCGAIISVVTYFSPAKTPKGVALKEYILGLKDYLQIAEKSRLEFHNAPDKKPEFFEKLLPYAMVLGVAEIWAKEFDGIYNVAPQWYSGSTGSMFNASIFYSSLSSFSANAEISLTSTPGGSGGGGSSGGGGGGGGGGSW